MLPLAEEVREARALVDESFHAVELTAGLYLVKFLLAQLVDVHTPRGDEELPGDAFIANSLARWPVDVPDLPPLDAPMSAHVAARWEQIQRIEAIIQPIADDYLRRSGALGDLVHDQYHLLEDPMFEDVVLDISAMDAERERLMVEVAPLQARQTGLGPMIVGLSAYRPVVATALASTDPVFWRGCADTIREGVLSLSAGLEVPLEPPPADDDARRDLARIEAWLAERCLMLEAERTTTQAKMEDIAARYANLTARMQGQTG